jgi:hypothetical protein
VMFTQPFWNHSRRDATPPSFVSRTNLLPALFSVIDFDRNEVDLR